MKKLTLLLAAAMLCFVLAACGNPPSQKIVSTELGIDVSGGTELFAEDTHGGFLGDGRTFIALQFDDPSVLDAVKQNSDWKQFPLDETTQTLVYGINSADEEGQNGPFLSDEQGNALVPDIQNGYYILIDRHTETELDILERFSFNFTVGLYDTDHNILYFGALDT